MAFDRLQRLGPEKLQRIVNELMRGTPAQLLARLIQQDWGDAQEVSEDTLAKQLKRLHTAMCNGAFGGELASEATPTAAAMLRVLHWVAAAGFSCVVLSTISFTLLCGTVCGLPGRGASLRNAAMPIFRKRLRQRPAFFSVMPSSAAMSVSIQPSAARKTIRARSTWRAARERARDTCSNSFRRSELRLIGRATRIESSSHCKDDSLRITVTI
jgi:hypothetical protein